MRFKDFDDFWQKECISNIAKITSGGTPKTNVKEYWNGTINWFTPTELTYGRFMSTLNSCSDLFYEQAESTLNIINLATNNTPKVEYEIKNRIDILKLIIEKVDELTNELVLNMSSLDTDSDEIKYLVEDMENLIKSVKDYK